MACHKDVSGDVDPNTGYKYEPKPFIDRVFEMDDSQTEGVTQHVTIISNVWGDYSYTTDGK